MISVGSKAARSGLRAGSALTIGAGGNELSKAIALLRSVGGRMYLPGLTSRVASDGSGAESVAGDVIGWLPDRVTGGLGPERMTTTTATTVGWTAYKSTLTSSGGELSIASAETVEGYAYHGRCVAGKTYLVKFTIVSLSGGTSATIQVGASLVSRGVGTHTVMFTASNANGVWLGCGSGGGRVAVYKDVSFKEVTAAIQATTSSKPKLIREPILGPELIVNGAFDSATGWGSADGWSIGSGVATKAAGVAFSAVTCSVPYTQLDTGRQYQVSLDYAASTSLVLFLRGSSQATLPASATTRRATLITTAGTSTASSLNVGASASTTATIDNISCREILGYTERYSLEFDGVDDYMAAPSAATLSDGLVMVWAGKQLSAAVGKRLLAGWDTTTLNEFGIGTTATGVDVRLRVSGYSELGTLSLPISIGSATVITIKLTATDVSVRFNGGAWSNAAHGRALPNTVLGFGLGARSSGPLPANCIMSASMVANLGANATDANIAILERAAAQAAGITL